MKMMNAFVICFVIISPVIGAFWSSSRPAHHEVVVKEGQRVVIEFEDESDGNTEVFISQHQDTGVGKLIEKCKHKVGNTFEKAKDVAFDVSSEFRKFEEHVKEVVGGTVEKFIEPNGKGNEKIPETVEKCKHKLGDAFGKMGNIVSGDSSGFCNIKEHVKEVLDEGVGKVGILKEKHSGKLSEKFKLIGGKAIEIAKKALGKTISIITIGDSAKGALKDSVVKIEEWDLVDSPKRIGEDIEQNATRKIEQGVEEVKETVEAVKETAETVKKTSLNDLLKRAKNDILDMLFVVSLEKIRYMISWCHLFGFSIAYGTGIWVTFFSSCVLGKCLPKQQFGMVLNKINMVYFRAMSYCVGAALLGYLVSRGKTVLSKNMEMFQGFNLLFALLMIVANLVLFEPRVTKLIVERMKMHNDETDEIKRLAEKLKKLNTYSWSLNVSTMVVLTWHGAYIGQVLQDRY